LPHDRYPGQGLSARGGCAQQKEGEVSEKIPSRFWQSVTKEEFEQILENDGCLNAELTARLWHMEDRQGDPPQSVKILIHRPTLERLLKERAK
jgi:hypothetical protein